MVNNSYGQKSFLHTEREGKKDRETDREKEREQRNCIAADKIIEEIQLVYTDAKNVCSILQFKSELEVSIYTNTYQRTHRFVSRSAVHPSISLHNSCTQFMIRTVQRTHHCCAVRVWYGMSIIKI